jgi:hypothetical protein
VLTCSLDLEAAWRTSLAPMFSTGSTRSTSLATVTPACCKHCNMIKNCLDPTTFLQRCIHIAHVHGGGGARYDHAWRTCQGVSYTQYQNRALKKGLSFELTKQEFDDLCRTPCYYCQRLDKEEITNGVDRKDNGEGYTMKNCVPCCGQCNQSKRCMQSDDFIQQCKNIANHSQDLSFERFAHIAMNKSVIKKRIMK